MGMEFIVLLVCWLVGLLVLYLVISKKIEGAKKSEGLIGEWLASMQASLNQNNQNMTSVLQKGYQDLHERLDRASQVIGELKREAGAFAEVGRGMKDLQDFLKSPKLRGNIGEQVLKDLIVQMFPKSTFNLQYAFRSGVIVDAAIKTAAGILPIDSKFPMENFGRYSKCEDELERKSYFSAFERDVKKHVRDISSKYILPQEGTMDFALMYIPSEAVYYEIVNDMEVVEYARQNRVYPVSPTTLYAHLQTILLSFEGSKIESKTKEVFSLLRGVQKDYQKLGEALGVLNRHLTNAYNQMNSTSQTMVSLGQKLSGVKELGEPREEGGEIK